MQQDDLSFEPLENGLDYVESVVDHLVGNPTPRDLKYAILHLAAAIEVILKARLGQEHWSLIFRTVDSAERSAFEKGDFESVGAAGAIDRLIKIVGLQFSDKDRVSIKRVIERRNRLQHHGLTASTQETQAVAVAALNFLIGFVDRQMRGEPGQEEAKVEATLNRIREALSGISNLVEIRMKSLKTQLEAHHFVLECPACGQEALVVDDPCSCLFCLLRGEPEDIAKRYVEEVLLVTQYEVVKDGGVWPISWCPSCERETLVAEGHYSAEARWYCFAEAERWTHAEIEACGRCGEPTLVGDHDDGLAVCRSCLSYYLEAEPVLPAGLDDRRSA